MDDTLSQSDVSPSKTRHPDQNKPQPASTGSTPQITIQSVYTRNHHCVVHILRTHPIPSSAWLPTIEVQANPQFTDLGAGQYEVVVGLRLTLKQGDQLLAEIQLEQAGLFTLNHIPDTQRQQVLYGICPNSLFPYASVWVNQTLAQAGLPPVFLAPLDFIALYWQYQQQQQTKAEQKPMNTESVGTVQ